MYGSRYMVFESPEEVGGGGLCFDVLCLFESIWESVPIWRDPR